jgi:hypothetical protein
LHWQRLAVTGADFIKTKANGDFEYLGFKVKRKGPVGAWKPYLDTYGDRCVEVDAIPSQEIRDRVEQAILDHVDEAQWAFLREQEVRERDMMRTRFGLDKPETKTEVECAESETEGAERAEGSLLLTEAEMRPPSILARSPALLAKIRAKIGRAYKKAGKADVSEDEKDIFCGSLINLGVPVEHRSSARIARVVNGEHPLEWLL